MSKKILAQRKKAKYRNIFLSNHEVRDSLLRNIRGLIFYAASVKVEVLHQAILPHIRALGNTLIVFLFSR
jgi:hypothetical protein